MKNDRTESGTGEREGVGDSTRETGEKAQHQAQSARNVRLGIFALDLLGLAEVALLLRHGAAFLAPVTARFGFVLGFALLTSHVLNSLRRHAARLAADRVALTARPPRPNVKRDKTSNVT